MKSARAYAFTSSEDHLHSHDMYTWNQVAKEKILAGLQLTLL